MDELPNYFRARAKALATETQNLAAAQMFCEEIEEWLQNSSTSGDELDSLLLEASDNYETMQRTVGTKRPQPLPEYTPPPLRTRVVPQPAPPPTPATDYC